ncbi:hypothetical protein CRBSH125_14270 [Afipia carboxidovorans]|nr:hypothetical protein CRBSH125_14270 [Afipia carboxidovorans]
MRANGGVSNGVFQASSSGLPESCGKEAAETVCSVVESVIEAVLGALISAISAGPYSTAAVFFRLEALDRGVNFADIAAANRKRAP